MTTQTQRPLETIAQYSELKWTPEDKAGSWESLDPWPCPPLGGVEIDKDGGYIRFQYRQPSVAKRHPAELATANFQMLKEFANLCRGNAVEDGSLLSFATRHGALGLCKEHGRAFAHTRPHCPSDGDAGGTLIIEPTARWLKFSRFAFAIVALIKNPRAPERDRELAILRSDPYHAILRWLQDGELKLWFRSRPARLTLYGVPPVWTALGLELATFAIRAKGIILCSACGRLDSIKHPRGNGDRRSYCSNCRVKGRKRDAAADLRGRKKHTWELHAQGKSVAEIVRELGFSPAQVKRYLEGEQ